MIELSMGINVGLIIVVVMAYTDIKRWRLAAEQAVSRLRAADAAMEARDEFSGRGDE